MRNSGLQRAAVFAGVVFLLAILVTQLVLTIRQESITWDEDDHIFAGYMSLKTGDFGLNPEHPPLVKMLAALPLLATPTMSHSISGTESANEPAMGGKLPAPATRLNGAT